MNRSALYWKWDSDVLDPAILQEKVRDLTSRTQISNIFIGMEWIRQDFRDPGISAAFRQAIASLHEAGRKAIIECCIRGEGVPFYREYPYDPAYLVTVFRGRADEHGALTLPHEQVWHYWRHEGDHGEHRVFRLYRVCPGGSYQPIREDSWRSEAVPADKGYQIRVHGTGIQPDTELIAVVGFPQPIPDLAHPGLIPYFTKMVRHAAQLGADGVFSDEWGYSVILDIREVNPYDDKNLNIRHISYSSHMEAMYREAWGESLMDTVISLFLPGHPQREAHIDRYLQLLRQICTQNEAQMYAVVKRELGEDAFWGVHPTWWGHWEEQNLEFFKNGFYWWDAQRDYAQTDESVILPIRTALAHRFSSPVWYNMWYSLGTRDIRTYYKESWDNLRFGGRTHYLGYECPNEAVVLDLRPEGLLESIEQLDQRIRLFDTVNAQPDCRLLVFFGFEAVSNWHTVGMEPPWTLFNPRLMEVHRAANGIFQEMLCDLVPSYAADNGSLYINQNGKLQYGSQEYDAVIALYPQKLSPAAAELLSRVDLGQLILCGDRDPELTAAVSFDTIPSADALIAAAKSLGVPENRWPQGCLLQDGSAMFTGSGTNVSQNPLELDFHLRGKHIRFSGEDALWLSSDGAQAIFPQGSLWIDSCLIESMR